MAQSRTIIEYTALPAGSSANPTVRRAMKMIQSRACQGLSVEELVRGLRISRSTLEREFESELGRTPAQMLKAVRLTRAGELLAETKF